MWAQSSRRAGREADCSDTVGWCWERGQRSGAASTLHWGHSGLRRVPRGGGMPSELDLKGD